MSNWVRKLPVVAIALAFTIAVSPVTSAWAFSAATGSVTGYVKSAATGVALQGVEVRLFDMNTAEFVADVVTNDEGKLDLTEVPFGLYQVTVVTPVGYIPAAGPLVSLTDETPEATVAFELETAPGAAVAQVQWNSWLFWFLFWSFIAALFGLTLAVTGSG